MNFKVGAMVVDCLRSLVPESASLPGMKAVVVDNVSGDGSVDLITKAISDEGWGRWASVMESERNGGFAYGNNAAIRPALAQRPAPDYVYLLNPDTRIRPGAVRELVAFLESRPEVGIAGGAVVRPGCAPEAYALRFPCILRELNQQLRFGVVSRLLARWTHLPLRDDGPCEVDWVSGANFMVRRDLFDRVGLMDEEYFLYFEEIDFCLLARRNGWSCWHVPQSVVEHDSGSSTGVTGINRGRNRLPAYWFRSRRRYFLKNHGWWYAAAADIAAIAGCSVWRLRRRIQRKPDGDPPMMLWDFIRNSVLATGPRLRNSSHTSPSDKGNRVSPG